MPRFSIRDLLIATALISIGLGLLYTLFTTPLFRERHFMPMMKYIAPAFIISGFTFMGAGIFAPFRRKLIGGLVGFSIAVGLILLTYASSPRFGGPRAIPPRTLRPPPVQTLPK
jgi:hypothetical protein